ncbi:MAG: hypothetical protein AAFQ57_17675 [Cyanobacteria bacterium J06626_14]
MKPHPLVIRLEQYTLKRPGEVLLATTTTDGEDEDDQVVIFRGFSSSLVRPTAFDPDIPVVHDQETIVSIDRLQGPYNPDNPKYLQIGLSTETIETLLKDADV